MAPCIEYGIDLTYVTSNCDNTTAGGTTYDGIYYPYTNRIDTGGNSYTVTWTGQNVGGNEFIYNPIIWRPEQNHWESWGGGGGAEPYVAPILTPEQAEAVREEQRIASEQQVAWRSAQANREQKAEGLIKEILGELEYTAFKKCGYIDIPSNFDPNKRYRVRPNRMIGVVKMAHGAWQEMNQSLCIHPTHGYVEGDVVATKIALCKFDERELLKTANVHERIAA